MFSNELYKSNFARDMTIDVKQSDIIQQFFHQQLKPDWITIYLVNQDNTDLFRINSNIYSVLCTKDYAHNALKDYHWNITTDYSQNNKNYSSFVIIQRFYCDAYSCLPRISEDFIMSFNLYFHPHNNIYYYIQDNCELDEVVRITLNSVEIKKKYLLRYLAHKQMCLLIFIYRDLAIAKYVQDNTEKVNDVVLKCNNWCYKLFFPNMYDDEIITTHNRGSILIGKYCINCSSLEAYDFNPLEIERRRYQEFIYDENPQGEELYHSCNPSTLANFYGANPGSPQFLTPIFFRRSVLQKYYDNPNTYRVTDAFVECGNKWVLQIDNDSDDSIVMASLGYLGQSLPFSEQQHWASYNIPPSDYQTSKSYRERMYHCKFSLPLSQEFRFKELYPQYVNAINTLFRDNVFKEFNIEFQKQLQIFRIPLDNTEKELDTASLCISKLFGDALNSNTIKRILQRPLTSKEKQFGSLKLYELLLDKYNIDTNLIRCLLDIQRLRSKSAGHAGDKDSIAIIKSILNEKTNQQFFSDSLLAICNSMESVIT